MEKCVAFLVWGGKLDRADSGQKVDGHLRLTHSDMPGTQLVMLVLGWQGSHLEFLVDQES